MYASDASSDLNQGDILEKVNLLDSAVPTSPPVERNIIVLSHDCEIDKPSNEVIIVAGVKLMSEVEKYSPGIKGDIKNGRVRNTMYLPPHGELEESCVDFRYIFRVTKQQLLECLKQSLRVVSLNDEGKQALCTFFGRYLFREALDLDSSS